MQIFLLQLIDKHKAFLDEQESKHCIKVLRHKEGDQIDCIDGKGGKYVCEISVASIKRVALDIKSKEDNWGEKEGKIVLAISPLRLRDRFEWAIEKAVELGVDEIYPIICKRSDPHKRNLKFSRIQTLLLTATKQCKRSRIPTLYEAQPFKKFLEQNPSEMNLLGYCESQTPIQHFTESLRLANSTSILIGPEGDFAAEEVQEAENHRYQTISLGNSRLRTETAAIYALSCLKFIRGF